MEFNDGHYRYRVVFADSDRIIAEVTTAMSVMLNMGCMLAVIMLPQYPDELLEVALHTIDENTVLPMQHGDILVNERDWFLQGRFINRQTPQPNPDFEMINAYLMDNDDLLA